MKIAGNRNAQLPTSLAQKKRICFYDAPFVMISFITNLNIFTVYSLNNQWNSDHDAFFLHFPETRYRKSELTENRWTVQKEIKRG